MPDIATRGADIPSAYTGGRNLGIENLLLKKKLKPLK